MTAWVTIPPLEQRAAECGVCCRVLDVLAHEATRLRKVSNMYRLAKLAGPDYCEAEIRRAAQTLHNVNMIAATTEGEKGKMKNPVLTDAGWDAATIARPFWMDGKS